ncbi:hypothetical protein ACRALDRAFT_207741 [Sodiomyces alcalophilus JCM 7366]|uniref:uncharacterized protein n=1 Tax=Sodiomyces alcalophilus JCM 7366 TaxID=591952 RepID=UPI0039B443D7
MKLGVVCVQAKDTDDGNDLSWGTGTGPVCIQSGRRSGPGMNGQYQSVYVPRNPPSFPLPPVGELGRFSQPFLSHSHTAGLKTGYTGWIALPLYQPGDRHMMENCPGIRGYRYHPTPHVPAHLSQRHSQVYTGGGGIRSL